MASSFARGAAALAFAGLAALAPVTASADVTAQEGRNFYGAGTDEKEHRAREKAVEMAYFEATVINTYLPEQCQVYRLESRRLGFDRYLANADMWCLR